MPSLNMKGPHDLTKEQIKKNVEADKIGNYALGRIDKEDDKFIVKYVGRSDDCLRTRLKDYIDEYDKFKFSYADSVKDAFEKECNNYHDFGENKLDNKIHPDRPEGEKWKCPQCK